MNNGSNERVAIADRLLVVGLIIAGVVLSALGDREHAGLLLAGALGALTPLATKSGTSGLARALPLALGLAGAVALSGCGGSSVTARDVVESACSAARVTCGAVEATCNAVTNGGER